VRPAALPAGTRLLIVDDNPTNRLILHKQAVSWGTVPEEAETPAEALHLLATQGPYGAAILDLQMPEVSGIDLAEQIRAETAHKNLPIVLYSSISQFTRAERQRVEALRHLSLLIKPIKPTVLLEHLARAVSAGPRPAAPQSAMQRRAMSTPVRPAFALA